MNGVLQIGITEAAGVALAKCALEQRSAGLEPIPSERRLGMIKTLPLMLDMSEWHGNSQRKLDN